MTKWENLTEKEKAQFVAEINAMKEYQVAVSDRGEGMVSVWAKSADDAWLEAHNAYKNGKYSHFERDVEIAVYQIPVREAQDD